ncbi:MAG: hypothetical protein J6Y94_07225 [Bacteriovoracaceae bacterium]|nr:hypothetical protein [Bacteriovoracaceae bacterium]
MIQEEAAGLSLAQRQQVAAIPVTTYEQTYKLKQLMLQRTPLPSYLPKAVHQVLERLAAEDSPLISPAALSYARQHYKAWNLWHPQRYAITPTLRQEIQALLNHTITLHPQRYGAVAGEIGYDFDPIVHQAAVRDLRFSYGQILVMQKVLAQIRFADFVEAVEAAEHGQKLQSTGLGQKLRDYEREHGLVLPHAAPEDADRTILDFWSAFDKRKFSRVELADLMKVAQQVLAAPLEKEEKNNYFLENMNLGYYRKTFTEPASHENFAQSAYDLPLELLYGVLSPNVLQRHTITTNTNAVNLAVPQHFYHVSSSAGEAAPAATCAQLLR